MKIKTKIETSKFINEKYKEKKLLLRNKRREKEEEWLRGGV